MKTIVSLFICLISNILLSQGASSPILAFNFPIPTNYSSSKTIDANGYEFELLDAGVNSEFSEFGSGFFRNKLILVSSKKLGAFAKIDPNTNEPYKDLFCLNISKNGQLSEPLLFSRILNTNDSEDQLTFTPNQKTVFYTRSSKENSLEYKLYKADLEEDSHGNWINQKLLDFNMEGVSIENPFVSPKGDKLYFSANLPDAIGGYDIYESEINNDGSLNAPKNLGAAVNTSSDEKYPALSMDAKYLYFSSKGHENMGGFDVFESKILNKGYRTPRNLGNTINTGYDEVAYFLAARNKGYVSSNRQNGKGGYDIYTVTNKEIIQSIKGKTLDLETRIKLPNTLVILKDEDGNEISRQLTGENATYSFNVIPFETYIITTQKDGFKDGNIEFSTTRGYDTTYDKDLELYTTEPIIAKVEDKLMIVIENIYFDFAKYRIKEESHVSLNKIIKVLNEHPEMKIAINAHTDNKGKDSYNLNLSEKRAATAVAYLKSKGIDKNRLQSKGFGETKPLIDCKSNCTDTELQSNRRIEFIILD